MKTRSTKITPKQQADIDAKKRFDMRKSWFTLEMQRQRANRFQMAMDEDYYDSIQWLPEEAQEVRARGQNPVVYNEIKPTIDWLLGTERRTRTDFTIIPRSEKSEEAYEDAKTKTKVLKYLDDVNRVPFERSHAFDDAMKGGLGWLEVGVKADPDDEPIYTRSESWRNMLYDSLGRQRDLSDARYLFRFREVDMDIAEAIFPDKKEELQRAVLEADNGSYVNRWGANELHGDYATQDPGMPRRWVQFDTDAWMRNPRQRVLLIECWSNEPFKDTTSAGAGIHDRTVMRKRVSVMTEYDTLLESWSPYKHERFPFIPVWAYRRKRDGAPYSPIRPIRGPQDMLNKQMSKAHYRMSVNKITMEKGAYDAEVMDLEDIREENSAPDGIVVLADGGLQKFKNEPGAPLAAGDLQLAERNIIAIRTGSGITGENRGLDTNAVSGKAVNAKQEQGSLLTHELFDHALLARQIEGEITLSLIEQFMTQPKVIAVAGERAKFEHIAINEVDPVTGQKTNDVTARASRFVIGEQAWNRSLAESAFQETMQLLSQLAPVAPNVVMAVLDLVFEFHPSLPNKQAMLQRIRQVTGQQDPDGKMTPEQEQAKQQQEAMAKAQFEAQMAQLQADIKEAQAKGVKLEADAMAKRLEGLYMAAQAAQVLTAAPQIAPVADELAKSVGFQDMNGQAPLGGPVPTQTAPVAEPPELMQADGALAGIETPVADGIDPNALPTQPTGELL